MLKILVSRIEFITQKGRISGDKRKMTYLPMGHGDKMVMKVSGIITKDATISIGAGLPNTTSKRLFCFMVLTLNFLFFIRAHSK